MPVLGLPDPRHDMTYPFDPLFARLDMFLIITVRPAHSRSCDASLAHCDECARDAVAQ